MNTLMSNCGTQALGCTRACCAVLCCVVLCIALVCCTWLPLPFPQPPDTPERVARVDMENKTVRQVGQDLLRLQERLESEKATR